MTDTGGIVCWRTQDERRAVSARQWNFDDPGNVANVFGHSALDLVLSEILPLFVHTSGRTSNKYFSNSSEIKSKQHDAVEAIFIERM